MRLFTNIQSNLSLRFRRLLSGAPDGIPPWVAVVAAGDEPGLYLPTDAPWVVHRDFGTLVGGIRALLMQALHPGSLAGVSQHSRYESDPLGRLAGTIRWLTVTTFGSQSAVQSEADRVNRLHSRVTGNYVDAQHREQTYRAADPNLLLWVHVAFMESFLSAHLEYVSGSIPKGISPTGPDNYVKQWGESVAPLGLKNVPQNTAEMDDVLDEFRDGGQLAVTDETMRVIQFIRKPPLPRSTKPVYNLLFQAAVVSLRPEFRKMLGLKTAPKWFIRIQARWLLRLLRAAVGSHSPVEEAALERLRRIGAWEESAEK